MRAFDSIVANLRRIERVTRPVDPETTEALARRWEELPNHVKTASQTLGRMAVGCEGTHGVFPRCNFVCTPCYHSRDANRVRVDGAHTVAEVERQMTLARNVRGPHAHAQLIGGEVSLLDPDSHAAALASMRRHGREPMSFSHGDFDYEYLEKVALGRDGKRRFTRLSFAGHFDTLMTGRRGLRRAESEEDLNPYRLQFCDMFRRLRRDHRVRYFLAHNMTVTPANVAAIPQVVRDAHAMGFGMMSFQPAAFVGDHRRWKEDYGRLGADEVWAKIEEGAGSRLPYDLFQTGDVRCNRTAVGYYLGKRWFPVLDPEDRRDMANRDAFYRYLGGVHWGAPLPLLAMRLARVLAAHPHLLATAAGWIGRRIRKAGGVTSVIRAIWNGDFIPMTFVMHRFIHADHVAPAWELMQRGEVSNDPAVAEAQERLQACFYAMAHPETGELVPACVQHAVLDPAENAQLAQLLPMPSRRPRVSAPTDEADVPQVPPVAEPAPLDAGL